MQTISILTSKAFNCKLLSERANKLLAPWTLFDDFEWKSTQLSNSNEWRMKINYNYSLIKWSTLHDVWVYLMYVCIVVQFGLCIHSVSQTRYFLCRWNNTIHSALFVCLFVCSRKLFLYSCAKTIFSYFSYL